MTLDGDVRKEARKRGTRNFVRAATIAGMTFLSSVNIFGQKAELSLRTQDEQGNAVPGTAYVHGRRRHHLQKNTRRKRIHHTQRHHKNRRSHSRELQNISKPSTTKSQNRTTSKRTRKTRSIRRNRKNYRTKRSSR